MPTTPIYPGRHVNDRVRGYGRRSLGWWEHWRKGSRGDFRPDEPRREEAGLDFGRIGHVYIILILKAGMHGGEEEEQEEKKTTK